MKKLISILSVAALTIPAGAATMTHFTSRFINGTYLCVSNSQTVSETVSNAVYFSYADGTNVLGGSTNAVGQQFPGPLGSVGSAPDMQGDVNPNLAVQIVMGYTNRLFKPQNMSVSMLNTVWTNITPAFTNATAQTNTVTITLYPVSSSTFGPLYTADSGKSFAFTATQVNSTPLVLTTNLPTSFLQGAYGIRATIANGAQAGTGQGVIINGLNLVGWTP